MLAAPASRPIALVTGGTRGIGRSIAQHLSDRGADVILTGRQRGAEAQQAVADLQARGARAAMLPLDLADDDLAGFIQAFRDQLTSWDAVHFHHLVNNAGVHAPAAFGQIASADIDLLYRVHCKGPLLLAQALQPLMAHGGRIINISTSLTRHVSAGSLAYAAMKSAMETATRYMALELGSHGISVNAVAPGATETDFFGGAVRDDPGVNQYVSQHTALGRAGRPDDIAGVVASLLEPQNHWLTAQRIEVSGGMLL